MILESIIVPKDLSDRKLMGFFQGWKWPLHPTSLVTIDFRQTQFMSPWAITLFAAYALGIQEVAKQSVRIKLDEDTYAGSYICETGFKELLGDDEVQSKITHTNRTTKLTRIRTSAEIQGFVSNFMKLLDMDDEELQGAFKYSLVELLRNVVQHSKSQIGGLAMAQFHPKSGLVELAVADLGIGIRAALQSVYPEIDNDLKALKFAPQPHVSGTFAPGAYNSMKDNAGLGLFFIKQIATLSSGAMFLASGKYILDVWGDADGQQHKLYQVTNKTGWPGTFAVLQLRRNTIGDFNSVLGECRRLAEEARKGPTKLALDFIDAVPELEGMIVINVKEFEENVDQAATIRDSTVTPALKSGKMIVLNFAGVPFATQSFVHALMYKIIRDCMEIASSLSIANCSESTREAILTVAGYAKVEPKH